MKQGKIIFVTGGVISSLGKGIIASSLARLLKDEGLSVNMMKCDPYLNVDSGTMSPTEHGETFVTSDGGETDLDLGHYERFLNSNLTKDASLTSGKVYKEIIEKERRGDYLGKTVQIIPHVTDLIKEKIYNNAKGFDLLIVEIGGSVGDIESLAYTEAIRQIKFEMNSNCLIAHAGYIPYVKVSKEQKTKPIQRSVSLLKSLGVSPDIIITRNESPLNKTQLDKISMFCNVKKEDIFQSLDISSIYKMPLYLKKQGLDKQVVKLLNLKVNASTHADLHKFERNLKNINLDKKINIGIVGKYVELEDAYLSIIEALKHASIANRINLNFELINARENITPVQLKKYSGIIVPGGFGDSGVKGKIKAIKYARENNIPFLGLCFGMQLAILEFSKNVCGLKVYHGEFDPDKENRIIDLMPNQKLELLGGTMRLGNYPCTIKPNTLAWKIYKKSPIEERHRHRYEFNNEFKPILEKNGLVFSGINKERNLVEIIEYPKNKFFLGVQFHPELSSKITTPHPIFVAFVKASLI